MSWTIISFFELIWRAQGGDFEGKSHFVEPVLSLSIYTAQQSYSHFQAWNGDEPAHCSLVTLAPPAAVVKGRTPCVLLSRIQGPGCLGEIWELHKKIESRFLAPLREQSQFVKVFSFQRKWYGFHLLLHVLEWGDSRPLHRENPNEI